jgi:hypothetical protein
MNYVIEILSCVFMALFVIFVISLSDYRKEKKVSLKEALKAHIEGIANWIDYEVEKFQKKI